MADELKSALAEQSWKAFRAGFGIPDHFDFNAADADGELALNLTTNDATAYLHPTERHALAALCLYQQPFGFTQADVDLLRSQSKMIRGVTIEPKHGEPRGDKEARMLAQAFYHAMADPFDDLATRIAALLPPGP